jgi:hypothetical protein
MKKNDTIYLLPQYDSNATKEEIQEFFQKKWEYAATLDYVPTSFEELTRIAFRDLKILMKRNDNFYNAVINRVEAWVLSHAFLCLIIMVSMLIALFTVAIFLLTGVSATDSGTMYNSMERII